MRRKNDRINRITREVLDIAHEATSQTSEALATLRVIGELTDLTIKAAQEAAAIASRQSAVIDFLREKARNTSPTEALNGAELEQFAKAVPQWHVSSVVSHGEASKIYGRTIRQDELTPDRQRGGTLEHDTYRSLADVEYSDMGLARIFDTYGYSGDYVSGDHFVLRIEAGEPGPITYGDFARVLDAEEYLVSAGYIKPFVPEPTAAEA